MIQKYMSNSSFDFGFNRILHLNQQSAKQQMQFQEYMSNTAHQREVADLQRAGLNPALSLNNGASSPAGAYANIDSSPYSARNQYAINKKQIDAQMEMNDKSLENAYKIAELNNQYSQAIQKYNTDMQYSLGLQQSKMQYDATMFGYANAFDIQRFLQSNENERFYYGYGNPKSIEEAKAYILRNSGALDSATNITKSFSNTVLDAMNSTLLGQNMNSGKSFLDTIKSGINTAGNWLAQKAHDYRQSQDSKDYWNKQQKDLKNMEKEIKALDGKMKLSGLYNDKYKKSIGYGSKYYNKGSSVK